MTTPEPERKEADPGLRIEQIDAELAELDQQIQGIKNDTDEAASTSRAELNERIQQLKSEKNQLLKEIDASAD